MNLKTTIGLFVVLVALLAAVRLSRDTSTTPGPAPKEHSKLVNLAEGDIAQIEIAGEAVEPITLVRQVAGWSMSKPKEARASASTVQSLLASLTNLRSAGRVAIGQSASAMGLDTPSTVTLTDLHGGTTVLRFGSRTGTGGNAYVRVGDHPEADLIAAALLDPIFRPSADFRETQLVNVPSAELQQIQIVREQGPAVELQRDGELWRVVAPYQSPADPAAVSDVTFALIGLRAAEFADEATPDAARYELDAPRLVVRFSDQPATTQPAATQPALQAIRFGRFDDVLKRNVFAQVDRGTIVKVAAERLSAFEKPALEYRDRKLIELDPATVESILISFDSSSTSQPADRSKIHLCRAAPKSTQPATDLATSKWVIASQNNAPADTAHVTALLRQFQPLRVRRYVESPPMVVNAPSVDITLETIGGAAHTIRLLRPESDDAFEVLGGYNELHFEAARSLLEVIDSDFAAPNPPAAVTQPS